MKVEFNVSQLISNQKRKGSEALLQMGEIIKEDANYYAPRDQDQLIATSSVTQISDTEVQIEWAGPKARFLYEGKVMVGQESRSAYAKSGETKVTINKELQYNKDKNPHAQKKWFEVAKASKKSLWIKQFQKLIEGER